MPAYLLVTHGSRDPRPQIEAGVLAQLLSPLLAAPHAAPPPVIPAVLELNPLPLHEQIVQAASQAIAAGHDRLVILPLFLLPGVHVMEDIPTEVAIARQQLGSRITIDVAPHLGSHPALGMLLSETPADAARILLSHGSRRPGGNDPIQAIARQIGAIAAYWSVAPSLTDQVTALAAQGTQAIEILPFFLFPGGITDAIAACVGELSAQFPQCSFRLREPLGATPKLAAIVADLAIGQREVTQRSA